MELKRKGVSHAHVRVINANNFLIVYPTLLHNLKALSCVKMQIPDSVCPTQVPTDSETEEVMTMIKMLGHPR